MKIQLADLIPSTSTRLRAEDLLVQARDQGELYCSGHHPLILEAVNALIHGGWLRIAKPDPKRPTSIRLIPAE